MKKRIIILVFAIFAVTFTGCASEREIKVKDVQIQAEEPDKEQIQADLVGSYLRWGEDEVWYFAALSEFDNVSINNKITRGNAIEYEVTFLLRDFELEKHFIMDVYLVYKIHDYKWQFVSYLVTDFGEMIIETH